MTVIDEPPRVLFLAAQFWLRASIPSKRWSRSYEGLMQISSLGESWVLIARCVRTIQHSDS